MSTTFPFEDVVSQIRVMLQDMVLSETEKQYGTHTCVHAFEGENAAVEIKHDQHEKRVWVFLRLSTVNNERKYYLNLGHDGNPVRDHIRNVARYNGWRCGPNIRGKEKETDAEALAADMEILSQNMDVIFLGNWKLKLHSGH